MDGEENSCYEFRNFRLDPAERLLTHRGKPVFLQPRAFDMLVALVEQKGHLVEKDELLEKVWQGSFVEEVNLTVHVSALRKTLGNLEDGTSFIETVPKRGYRFAVPVLETVADAETEIARRFRLHAVSEEIEADDAAAAGAALNSHQPRQRWLIASAVILIATLILSGTLWNLRHKVFASGPDFSSYSWRAMSADDKTGVAIVSPNGEFVVFMQPTERGTDFKLRRMVGEETITLVPNVDVACWGITISHDNNFLYYVLADRPYANDGGTLYRVSMLGGQPRKVVERITASPTLSPDDRRFGFMRNGPDGTTQLMTANANDGSDERVVSSSANQTALWNPQWSPDGQKIVCFIEEKRDDGIYYTLVEIPADGGEIRRITEPSRKRIWWHTWMHDGSGLLAIRSDDFTNLRQIVFVSYPDGSIKKISNDLNQYSGVSVSDDGATIGTDREERLTEIVIADETGDREVPLKISPCCPDAVSWLPDGRIVFDAFAEGKRSLWRIAVDGGGQEKLFSTDAQDWSPNASPDGTSFIFLSTRSGSRQIWRSSSEAGKPEQVTQINYLIDSPKYSADGSWIYFSILIDFKWKVARIKAAGGEPEIVRDENIGIWDVSPDGRNIAYTFWPDGSKEPHVAVAEIESREIKYRYEISPKDILRWTPDGRQLIYEQPDPTDSSRQIRTRQSVSEGGPLPPATQSYLKDYFMDISPNGHQIAYVRGHVTENAAMLVRK